MYIKIQTQSSLAALKVVDLHELNMHCALLYPAECELVQCVASIIKGGYPTVQKALAFMLSYTVAVLNMLVQYW